MDRVEVARSNTPCSDGSASDGEARAARGELAERDHLQLPLEVTDKKAASSGRQFA